jgi:succinoglycan biosynthesis transport protein ExoP
MNPNRLKKLVRKWTLPVAALAVLGAVVAYLFSKSLTPIYEARGSVLVIAGPSQAAGSGGLNLNATQATTTAATLMTEPPLLQKVIDTLHLNMTESGLNHVVTATPENNTELVDVFVRDPDPILASQITNAIMTTYVAQITTQNTQRISQAGAALQAQITQVQNNLNQEQQDLATAQKAGQDTAPLRATIAANSALLQTLTVNYSSFQATQSQNLETVSVAAASTPPVTPVTPRVLLNTAIGGLIGLLLGLGGVALVQYLDQGLHSPEDVQERLGLPCLGVVPRYRTTRLAGPQKNAARDKRAAEAASEAYRRLRTNVLFSTPDGDLTSIVLTSVRSGEGKTCTAANLAVALASSDKRVLLIDADMRRPDQHRLFGKGLGNGMSEMILATRPTSIPPLNGLHSTQFDNLSLITSGTIPPNPSELLASERAHTLLRSLADQHDLLVIDTPPAGVVADALTLAADASITILVVEAARTNAGQAAAVVDSLRSVGANVVGVVLNKAASRNLGGYYYQYGGYGYTPDAAGSSGKRKAKGKAEAQLATDRATQQDVWAPVAESPSELKDDLPAQRAGPS